MKQAIDTRTAELSGLDFSETGNAAPAPKRARGPYRGAVRLGSSNQADRARAGLTQEACAALAGVSVRALRMWEHSRNPSRECPRVHARVIHVLLPALHRAGLRTTPRYMDSATGQTWAGKGLMPAWLRQRLDAGAQLSDFEVIR